ncbi:MAG: ABC transporter substrate-binding protein [Pseudomonadota bacterium]
MTRGLSTIIGALAMIAFISACAPNTQRPSADPAQKTFVSLNPCLDAILVEVAEAEQVLAISHYSHQPGGSRMAPELAAQFAFTGGTAEEIIALQPDIVLASIFLPPATKSALERAGLEIETFDIPRSVDVSVQQVRRMGQLVGNPEAAQALNTRIAAPRLEPPYKRPDPSVLLWQAGQITAGQKTLISRLIKDASFTSHSEALGLGQGDYVSLEQVVSDPPDLLLVAGQSAGQQHPALAMLEGTRVHAFDPSLFYCGGPSIADARAELRALRQSFEGRRE